MTSSTSWNDVVNKLKGVTIGTRSVSQSNTKDYWGLVGGDFTFLTRIDVDATGVYNNGYNAGYGSGRSQGQSDVTSNPNGYGLYTKSQYDANWSNGYNSGSAAKASKVWTSWIDTTAGGYWNVGFEPHFILVKRRDDRLPIGVYSNYGSYFNYMVGPSNSYYDGAFSVNGSGFSLTGNLNNYTKNKGCYAAAIRIV